MIALAPLMPRLIRGRRTVGRRQLPFLESDVLFRAFHGGRGSGKTYAGALAAFRESGRQRCTGTIVAPTYTMLNDDVVPVLRGVCGETLIDFSTSEMHGTFWNGSEVFLRSAPDSLHVNRLRGPSRSWLWLEEAAYIPDGEDCWKIGIATLREGKRMGRAWLTTTPRGKGWIHRIFVTDADANYALFGSHTDDNEFTTPLYKQILKESYGVGWFARQELAGEFCDPAGNLFQREWFEGHIVDEAPPLVAAVRGWDLACTTKTTSDYTAGVRLGVTENGDYYVLHVVHGKWQWPDAEKIFTFTCQSDGVNSVHRVEEVGFQHAAVQSLLARPSLAPYAIGGRGVDRDKLSNALPVASRAQAGKLYLVRGAWNQKFIDEACAFSGDGKGNDDQVDGLSIAYHSLCAPEVRLRT